MAAAYTEEVTGEAVRRAEEGIGIWLEPDRLAAARGLGRLGERLQPARALPLVPRRVAAAICRDAVAPDLPRGSPVEALRPAPGGQQRLLEKARGILNRAEHALAMQLELRPAPVGELAERPLVFRAGAGERSLGHTASSHRVSFGPGVVS
jgi:hypothetical protein